MPTLRDVLTPFATAIALDSDISLGSILWVGGDSLPFNLTALTGVLSLH